MARSPCDDATWSPGRGDSESRVEAEESERSWAASERLISAAEAAVENTPSDPLPPTLYVHGELRVLVCQEHGSCYTKANCSKHLLVHGIKGRRKKSVVALLEAADLAALAAAVVRPAYGGRAIDGLPKYNG